MDSSARNWITVIVVIVLGMSGCWALDEHDDIHSITRSYEDELNGVRRDAKGLAYLVSVESVEEHLYRLGQEVVSAKGNLSAVRKLSPPTPTTPEALRDLSQSIWGLEAKVSSAEWKLSYTYREILKLSGEYKIPKPTHSSWEDYILE